MHGALIAEGSLFRVMDDAINVAPPLIVAQAEVDEMFDHFSRVTRAVERAEAGA